MLVVTMADGNVHEVEQPHLRGGAREPLSPDELRAKYHANAAVGNIPIDLAVDLEAWCETAFEAADMSGLARFKI